MRSPYSASESADDSSTENGQSGGTETRDEEILALNAGGAAKSVDPDRCFLLTSEKLDDDEADESTQLVPRSQAIAAPSLRRHVPPPLRQRILPWPVQQDRRNTVGDKPNFDGIGYVVLRQLGSGTYGDVYLAEHKCSGQKVAIKRSQEIKLTAGVPTDVILESKILVPPS